MTRQSLNLRTFLSCTEQGAFALFSQRLWRIDQQTSMGTEILLRIPNAQQTGVFQSTDTWIDFAEKNNLLEDLTLKIFAKLLSHPKLLDPAFAPYFVNVSPPVLTQAFTERLITLIEASHVPFHLLGLELTERQPIPMSSEFQLSVQTLRTKGMTLALDDYGQGFSTMRFLRDLHIDRVKIDQKLLRGARRHPKRRLALTSLLEFATDFGLEVLAEGIETKADFEFAEALNCDGVQGFYLDHPTVFLPQNGALGQSSISAFPVTTGSLIENSNVSV